MKYTVEIAGRSVAITVDGERILLDGKEIEARLIGSGPVRRVVRGRASREFVTGSPARGEWSLQAGGHRFEARVLDALEAAARASGGGAGTGGRGAGVLKAPMPGLVVRTLVSQGDRVVPGQGLVVLEAMKMENELKAAVSGVVLAVHVAAGAKVEKGAVLVEIEEGKEGKEGNEGNKGKG